MSTFRIERNLQSSETEIASAILERVLNQTLSSGSRPDSALWHGGVRDARTDLQFVCHNYACPGDKFSSNSAFRLPVAAEALAGTTRAPVLERGISIHWNEKTKKVWNLALIFAFGKSISSNSSTDTITMYAAVIVCRRSDWCCSNQLTRRCQIYSIRLDNWSWPDQFEWIGLRPDSNSPIRLPALHPTLPNTKQNWCE